jgi:hypothetical protein
VVSVMGTERVPLRAADQAALLLDWGYTVPAGTAGVGRLVDSPDDVPPPAATGPVEAAAAPPAGVPGADDGGSVLLPVGLAVTAAGIVVATVVGCRRAVRFVPVPVPLSGPEPRSGRPRVGPPGPGPRPPRARPPAPGAGSRSRRP